MVSMTPHEHNESVEDAPAPSATNWPQAGVVGSIFFGWVSCQFCIVPALDGPSRAHARFVVTTAIAALFLARSAVATIRKEQSRGWIFYTAVSILAVPLWFMGEMVNAWLF